jgi:hypothetical protein
MRRAFIAILGVLLSACGGQPARVDTARTDGPDRSYTVDLPLGWVKQRLGDNTLFASRDGPLLESIYIARRTGKEAFPRTKKGAADNMLAAELAELEIAEVKSQDPFTAALNVLENEPALVSGRDAFRIKLVYKNTRGLEIGRVIYGFTDASSYYRIQYIAPKLYYFDRYYPDFEKSVASLQVVKR